MIWQSGSVGRIGSVCRPWAPAGLLTLTTTKRPLGPCDLRSRAATNGRSLRCSYRRPLETRFAVPATGSAWLELVLPTHCRSSVASKADIRKSWRPSRRANVCINCTRSTSTTEAGSGLFPRNRQHLPAAPDDSIAQDAESLGLASSRSETANAARQGIFSAQSRSE